MLFGVGRVVPEVGGASGAIGQEVRGQKVWDA